MKSKKGVLFSIMAVLLITPLILLTISYTQSLRGYGKEMGDLVRIKSGFFFLKSANKDFERGIKIVGKRSLTAAVNNVIFKGESLDDSETRIKELFMNGTLYGENISLMNDTTIKDWKEKINELAEKRGFTLNLKLQAFNIGMEDSFNIFFLLNYSLKLKDKNQIFSFNKNYSKRVDVSILGMEDPLFPLYTQGKISVSIESCPYSQFTNLLLTGSGGNGFSGGKSFLTNDPSGVSNKNEKILVIENANISDVNDFAGVVFESNTTEITVPWVKNSTAFTLIPNNTRIALLGDEGEVWNVSNLYKTWENQLYVEGNGPSFLDRLEGNFNNSYIDRGMETFVIKEDLRNWGLEVKGKSNIDHIYFKNESVINYNVKGMSDDFMIDNEIDKNESHIEIYDVEELVY